MTIVVERGIRSDEIRLRGFWERGVNSSSKSGLIKNNKRKKGNQAQRETERERGLGSKVEN